MYTATITARLGFVGGYASQGLQANVITYNATISTCGKSQQWRLTLELLENMLSQGVQANAITYSATSSACGRASSGRKVIAPGAVAWAVPAMLSSATEVILPARDPSLAGRKKPPIASERMCLPDRALRSMQWADVGIIPERAQ